MNAEMMIRVEKRLEALEALGAAILSKLDEIELKMDDYNEEAEERFEQALSSNYEDESEYEFIPDVES